MLLLLLWLLSHDMWNKTNSYWDSVSSNKLTWFIWISCSKKFKLLLIFRSKWGDSKTRSAFFIWTVCVCVCDLKLQKLAQNHLNSTRERKNRKFFPTNHFFCAKNTNYQIDFDFYTHADWHPINWIYSRQLHKTWTTINMSVPSLFPPSAPFLYGKKTSFEYLPGAFQIRKNQKI